MKDQMKFVFPNRDYEEKAKDFIREFDAYGSESNGSGGLDRYLHQRNRIRDFSSPRR